MVVEVALQRFLASQIPGKVGPRSNDVESRNRQPFDKAGASSNLDSLVGNPNKTVSDQPL